MNYDLTHKTTYDYSDLVSVSHHLLRLRPRVCPGQRCLTHELQVDPPPTVLQTYTDYYGNETAFVTLHEPHRRFTVTSHSRVAVTGTALPEPAETPTWENVRDLCRGQQIGAALDANEFLFNSPHIHASDVFADYAAPSFSPGRPVLAAVLDLTRRIHSDFMFDPKATTVATPLEEVFKSRRGVCQDFAQLEIACLRSLWLPARYVSGYLETDAPPGQARLLGADASHAWLGFFCHGIGWIDVDPTNNLLPSMRHVTVAWGRDYSDVSPIRGVVLGGGKHTLKVEVDVLAAPEGVVTN